MPLRPSLVAALASSANRRRRARGDTVSTIGKGYVAVLSTNQRSPVLTRKAATKSEAFSLAHRLLDDAEDRQCFNGETVSVQIGQADGVNSPIVDGLSLSAAASNSAAGTLATRRAVLR